MKKQDLFIFIGMIILIGVFFVIYLITSLFGPAPIPEASPLPSAAPSQKLRPFDSTGLTSSAQPATTPLPSLPPEETKNRAINTLPVITPAFNIEYYYEGDIFRITVKQNPYSKNKSLAEDWLKNQGLNPSRLNIFWDAYPEVER